jgi:hypothetical protein
MADLGSKQAGYLRFRSPAAGARLGQHIERLKIDRQFLIS